MAQSPPRAGSASATPEPGSAGPFRIHVAAELSGVSPATLRAWERRYGVPVPRRTASAYRLYTPEDVAQIKRMRQMVEEGIAPSEAARSVLGSSRDAAPGEPPAPTDALELAQARILSATQRWDAASIDAELTRLSIMLDAVTFYERVVSPLLVELGDRWARNELSIAQEHLLSERLEIALRAILRTMERTEGPLVILACTDAELHVLGLLGAALRFASNGARIALLGAMTPPSAVADAVRSLTPRLVGLSSNLMPTNPHALVRAYADACGSTPWVLGGRAAHALAPVVEACGGKVALGSAAEWNGQVRDWLRGAR